MMIEKMNIPNHWQARKLREICQILSGYGFPKVLQGSKSGKFPFYKVGDISKNVKAGNRQLKLCDNYIDETIMLKLKAKPFPKNTIVFAKIGEGLKLNRRAIIDAPGIVDNNVIGLKATENCCDDLFLFNFLTTVKLEDYSKATTVPSVRKSEIEEIPFPLPPLAEQQAIVSKIEELLSDLENGKQQLLTAQQQLKIYRQSLLKSAFEGKLTNNNVKDRELPKGWKWVKLIDILENNKHALKAGPFGSSLKKEFYVKEGYKVYGQEQVISDNAFWGDYFINEDKYQELKSCKIKPYDILISLVGTVGKVLILPENCQVGVINPRLIKISINKKIYLHKFFKYYFESSCVKNFYSSKAQGTTMDVLNLRIINTIPFPLPSINEQQCIVDELESKLAICDKVDETISNSLQQAEKLKQSILKKAFEGKLVKAQLQAGN